MLHPILILHNQAGIIIDSHSDCRKGLPALMNHNLAAQ